MTKYKSLSEEKLEKLADMLGIGRDALSVYLASLELGVANIQELSRKSGVKRTSIYNFIDELKLKQFLTEIKRGKRKLVLATNPRLLIDTQKSRVDFLESMMPELLAINNEAKNKPRVSYYEGFEGIKEVYNSMLRDKQVIYAWEDLDQAQKTFPKKFFESYPVERSKLTIPFRSIVKDSPFARKFTFDNDKRLSRQSKFISASNLGTEINIFGNKVALFNLRKSTPLAVLIQDHEIAETLKIIWQELWDRLSD